MIEDRPELDAIIIADSGIDSLSGTNPLKLHIEGRVGAVQVVSNLIHNKGFISEPIEGENRLSWSSAPKLNGLYLLSFLSKKNLHVELIHNFAGEKEHFATLLKRNPRSVIISTSFIFFKRNLRQLAAEIRAMAPDIFIIAGGAFVYYSYLLLERSGNKDYETELAEDDFLFLRTENEPDIDLYIAGPRGESSLLKALQEHSNGKSFSTIENSVSFDGKAYVFGPRFDDVSHAFPIEIDWQHLPESVFQTGVIPLQASNGCPYNCTFCNFTKDKRLNFLKPIDRLIAELQSVQEKGIKYVWFVDDNFRLGRNDLNDVCLRFIQEGIRVQWMCFIRAGTLKDTNLDLLKKAGCIEVQIGLESGDTNILKNMNKQADPEMYNEVIGKVLNHGINVSCYFITGFPGETEETAATTRNFIKSIENPNAPGTLSWSIYPFLLTPLAPIYEPWMREKYDLHGYLNNWSHRTMDFKQAKQLVGRAFMELEESGPIYREDNLDMLANMSNDKKKDFFRKRNYLAKKAMKGPLTSGEITSLFREIL